MQVFVPYKNPLGCAAVLDARRLNKQILECRQILAAIRGESNAWRNHPCVKMYRNHLVWLEYYQHCLECYDTPALKAHSFRGGMKTQTDASR